MTIGSSPELQQNPAYRPTDVFEAVQTNAFSLADR
jgi:hypothetical protein